MIPEWAMKLPLNLIYQKSTEQGISPELFMAIIWNESRGFVYAVRYEPLYRWLYNPKKYAEKQNITLETEINLQKQSYGLCQIMGATARWLTFSGALPGLYKPENNLYWGARYLSHLTKKYQDPEKVASSYNQGSPLKGSDGNFVNQKYVTDVMNNLKQLQKVN